MTFSSSSTTTPSANSLPQESSALSSSSSSPSTTASSTVSTLIHSYFFFYLFAFLEWPRQQDSPSLRGRGSLSPLGAYPPYIMVYRAHRCPRPPSRAPAWTGARASPTFSPSNTPRPQSTQSPAPSGNFPALGHANGARTDTRLLQALAGLTVCSDRGRRIDQPLIASLQGTTVTLTTKTGIRYEGVIASTSNEGDTTGVTLKDAKDITAPGAPLKDSIFIASTNIESYTSGPADAKPTNGDSTFSLVPARHHAVFSHLFVYSPFASSLQNRY